jgi:hypothetical protein
MVVGIKKVLYKPLSITFGVLCGIVAGMLFKTGVELAPARTKHPRPPTGTSDRPKSSPPRH